MSVKMTFCEHTLALLPITYKTAREWVHMTLSQKDTFNKGLHIAGFIASFVKAEEQFKCNDFTLIWEFWFPWHFFLKNSKKKEMGGGKEVKASPCYTTVSSAFSSSRAKKITLSTFRWPELLSQQPSSNLSAKPIGCLVMGVTFLRNVGELWRVLVEWQISCLSVTSVSLDLWKQRWVPQLLTYLLIKKDAYQNPTQRHRPNPKFISVNYCLFKS